MKRKTMTYSNAGFGREATQSRLNFANMSDAELAVWVVWFGEHNEQEWEGERERSYFRVNKASMHAEKLWRNKEIPPMKR